VVEQVQPRRVHDRGSPTAPAMVQLHSSSGVRGVGPAESTEVVDDVLARRDTCGIDLRASPAKPS
jgi:hypothetical protein